MNATTLHVDLEVAGVQSGQLLVRLSEGGQVISRERITIQPNTRDYRATLAYVPTTVGQFVYEVEVEVVSGELDTDNNRRAILVDVIRDKTRVLQVVGQPSWDQRFLREHLKQTQTSTISFFILLASRAIARRRKTRPRSSHSQSASSLRRSLAVSTSSSSRTLTMDPSRPAPICR